MIIFAFEKKKGFHANVLKELNYILIPTITWATFSDSMSKPLRLLAL